MHLKRELKDYGCCSGNARAFLGDASKKRIERSRRPCASCSERTADASKKRIERCTHGYRSRLSTSQMHLKRELKGFVFHTFSHAFSIGLGDASKKRIESLDYGLIFVLEFYSMHLKRELKDDA